jgi:hypothetical protein
MSAAFLPLVPGKPVPTPPRGRLGAAVPAVQPGDVPGGKFAGLTAPPESLARPEPDSACDREPVLTLRRDGDQLTHIEITCGCGRVTLLKCEY